MKFVCMGYIDESKWQNMPEDEKKQAMEEVMAYEIKLRLAGQFTGGGALDSPTKGVTLRYRYKKVTVTDGPCGETKEQSGGILLLEARDLKHAIELMSKHPGDRMGPF